MPRVLVVDSDRTVLHYARQTLSRGGVQVSTAASVRRARLLLAQKPPDLIVADAQLAEDALWDAISPSSATGRRRVIALVASASPRRIVQAAARGAAEILTKPLDYARLREVALKLLAWPAGYAESNTLHSDMSFVAGEGAMHDVVRDVARAAACDFSVLFTGEAGTGKTHLARVVERHSARAREPCGQVELAGKTAERLLDELFGHERGAFTLAHERRLGSIERCDGGTLLLEQIDALPTQVQGRLLSIFEERAARRLGADEPRTIDVRVLSTTRGDLARLVDQKKFRADLYHDLREFTITLPPLRERLDDLPRLAAWFLTKPETHSGEPLAKGIAADALDAMRQYHWPGNLWELASVLRAASWRSQGGVITPDDLPHPLRPERSAAVSGVQLEPSGLQALEHFLRAALTSDAQEIYSQAVALFDRYICARTLAHTSGNQSHAARLLGMTRRSLRTKVRRFDLAHRSGPRRPRRRK